MNKILTVIIASCLMLACATPEERMVEFTENGDALMEEGKVKKAILEYRNALQINEDHIPALRGLLVAMEADGNERQVTAILVKITQLDPTDVDSRVRLGRQFLVVNRVDLAKDLIDQAVALAPDNAQALAIQAGILLKLEDEAGAIETARNALTLDPSLDDAYSVLAAERVIKDDVTGAIQLLDEGLAAGSNPVSLRLIKIEMLRRNGEIDEAISVYDQLLELSPDDTLLRRGYAEFLANNGRLDGARAQFKMLAQIQPESDEAALDYTRFLSALDGKDAAKAYLQTRVSDAEDRYVLRRAIADLKRQSGDIEGAFSDLKSLTKDAGTAPVGLEAKAAQAQILIGQKKLSEAASLITEILAADERQASALALRASIALEERRLDDAIVDLRTVLRDVPNSIPSLTLLGRAHELNGSPDLAEDRYAQAFRASNAAPSQGLTYAEFLSRTDNLPLAEDVLGAVLARSSGHLPTWRALAQVRLLRSDWIGAYEAAERIRALGDDSAIVNEISGTALRGMNRLNESLDAFKTAHEAAPTNARPLVGLVRAYLASGRLNEAISFLETLTQNNPENTLGRVLLAQTYTLDDQPEQAEAALIAARAAQPDALLAHQSLYQFFIRRGEVEKAGAAVEQGVAAMPNAPAMLLLKASYLELVQDHEAAIGVYETLYADDESSQVVANNLASLLAEYRDDEDSLMRAQRIAERFRGSDIPYFRDTLGWAYFRTGQTQVAVDILEGVVEQLPELAIFRYHLGLGYLEQGSSDAARSELEKALELAEAQATSGVPQELIRDVLDSL